MAELSTLSPVNILGSQRGFALMLKFSDLSLVLERPFGESLEKHRLCNQDFKVVFIPQGN